MRGSLTPLIRFLAMRCLTTVLLVWLAASSMLLLVRLAPGDALSDDSMFLARSKASLQASRERLGLDKPWWELYGGWLVHAIRLDFGTSIRYGRPVTQLVTERAANTAILALSALFVATIVGLPLGVIAGSGRPRAVASTVRIFSIVALSAPPLLTSLILAWFAARTGWFPIGGMRDLDAGRWPFDDRVRDALWHLALPVLALALPLAATFERLQADAVAAVRAEPFIISALARGLPHARVLWRDLWRPALGPVVALYGLAAGHLLSGALAVELVSAWPGLGRLMFEALGTRDLPLAAGCAAAAALFLGIWTMLSDLALRVVDPRLREHDVITAAEAEDVRVTATTEEPQPW
jgi:peptide/nickel transport system permease protein